MLLRPLSLQTTMRSLALLTLVFTLNIACQPLFGNTSTGSHRLSMPISKMLNRMSKKFPELFLRPTVTIPTAPPGWYFTPWKN